jgi:hypothetical protein
VASDIWKRSAFESPPLSWLLLLYAPPNDGATAIVHAATVPWGSERGASARLAAQRRTAPAAGSSGSSFGPEDDLRVSERCGACNLVSFCSPSLLSAARLKAAHQGTATQGTPRQRGHLSEAARTPRCIAELAFLSCPRAQFYARGLFASPPITAIDATPRRGLHGALSKALWAVSASVLSVMDWPARRLSGGRLAARTTCVPSSSTSYDAELAGRLWNAAADAAGVPREVQAPGGHG